ncbi:DUF2254 family protein [Altererythrobacter sp. CAU 1778]
MRGRLGWLWHRIFASYWSLPVLAVLSALPIAVGTVLWDRDSLTSWIIDRDLDPVITADTAKDLVGVAVGINAAFLTLYFSITLLVLTVASSNLGVRLVDRWLDKGLVRVSLSGLAFTLVYSLAVMSAIDADAAIADTPLGSVAAVIGFQALNVAMLSVALHDLGRTIFVDRSIHYLGREAASGPAIINSAEPLHPQWSTTFRARQEGYVEGNDTDTLGKLMSGSQAYARICAAPGQHVMEGDPLVQVTGCELEADKLHDIVPIGNFRSDGQGTVFQVRLLVEIAARALSPAVNDFYTAIACADRLAAAMDGQFGSWIDRGKVAVYAHDTRIELPGQDFHGLFADPLAAFRQAACQYPSVSIRMIDNYARLIERARAAGHSAELVEFLMRRARELGDHARDVTQFEGDKTDIAEAIARCEDATQA